MASAQRPGKAESTTARGRGGPGAPQQGPRMGAGAGGGGRGRGSRGPAPSHPRVLAGAGGNAAGLRGRTAGEQHVAPNTPRERRGGSQSILPPREHLWEGGRRLPPPGLGPPVCACAEAPPPCAPATPPPRRASAAPSSLFLDPSVRKFTLYLDFPPAKSPSLSCSTTFLTRPLRNLPVGAQEPRLPFLSAPSVLGAAAWGPPALQGAGVGGGEGKEGLLAPTPAA